MYIRMIFLNCTMQFKNYDIPINNEFIIILNYHLCLIECAFGLMFDIDIKWENVTNDIKCWNSSKIFKIFFHRIYINKQMFWGEWSNLLKKLIIHDIHRNLKCIDPSSWILLINNLECFCFFINRVFLNKF